MKIFKDIDGRPKKLLLKNIQQMSIGLFCFGLMTGLALVLTGMSAKNDDFEKTFIMAVITIFFLLLSILARTFLNNKLLPEIEKRLHDD
ncbi:MAG: O-antigen ligase [Candidatus Endobugula sp.]|jgi:O-antigen ligase